MSCGVGHRCGLDPELLWLWCRLPATALIRPLAWEPPYAEGAALEFNVIHVHLDIKKKKITSGVFSLPVLDGHGFGLGS